MDMYMNIGDNLMITNGGKPCTWTWMYVRNPHGHPVLCTAWPARMPCALHSMYISVSIHQGPFQPCMLM